MKVEPSYRHCVCEKPKLCEYQLEGLRPTNLPTPLPPPPQLSNSSAARTRKCNFLAFLFLLWKPLKKLPGSAPVRIRIQIRIHIITYPYIFTYTYTYTYTYIHIHTHTHKHTHIHHDLL